MNAKYFQYINLPSIPERLIELDLDKIESKKKIFFPKNIDYQYYKKYHINDDLNNFLKSIIHIPFSASYQIITEGIHIHKDIGRIECFNYLLDTGGDESRLIFYDEDKSKILLEKHIERFKWHWLFVRKFHTVKSLVRPRIAISVGIDTEYSYNKYKIQSAMINKNINNSI